MLLHPALTRERALTGLHRDHSDDVETRSAEPADAPIRRTKPLAQLLTLRAKQLRIH